MKTFYWYDYETFGISPKVDRISQFAGVRTDEEMNIIQEHKFYCKPTNDCLPSPEACQITGISPQLCEQKGVVEHEFIKKIHYQLSQKDTCVIGYNSIRFDDEFTRHTLYRNFIDSYTWHWKNGNTRWDILDVVRMCYAFKKDDSLNWVFDKEDKPIFKLDQLSVANGIEHADAHDALADVHATIAIAKIIKNTQPRLFQYAFELREKKTVAEKIQLFEPMLHTSGMYPAQLSCTRLSVALSYHPEYNNQVIVFNLDQDPSILLKLNIKELQTLMFTKQSELPKGIERLQIKTLNFNKSPMFVLLKDYKYKLKENIIQQLQLNMDLCMQHLTFIKNNQAEIQNIVQKIYQDSTKMLAIDVDQSLYDGFINDAQDRRICSQIQGLSTDALTTFNPQFKDLRLAKLLLHFKGRNYPNSLNKNQREEWFEVIQSRIQDGAHGYVSLDDYFQRVEQMRQQYPDQETLWQQLEDYAQSFL